MGEIIRITVIDREAQISLDGLNRRYRVVYEVETDSPLVEGLQVSLAPGIPRWGEPYIYGSWSDLGAICMDVKPRQPDARDNPEIWHVDVEWRSITANPDKQGNEGGGGGSGGGGGLDSPQTTNPLLQRPSVNWGLRSVQVPIKTDINGNPIQTSAGDPYAYQPREIKIRTLTVTQHEKIWNPFTTLDYIDATNKEVWQGRPAGCVVCDSIVGNEEFGNGVDYSVVTYMFSFAPKNDPTFWKLRLIDKGPRYIAAKPPPHYAGQPRDMIVAYVSNTGISGGEIFLDGKGRPHPSFKMDLGRLWEGGIYPPPPATGGVFEPAGIPHENIFTYRDSRDFRDLNLPDPA